MTDLFDFGIGDRVTHPVMGDGEVVSISDAAVHVTYDQCDRHGKPWKGIYNAAWFRIVGALQKAPAAR